MAPLGVREVEPVEEATRFGGIVVGVGRMLPTVRSIVSVPAGLLHMRLRTFFVWSTIGTAGWTGALAAAGHLLGEHSRDLGRYIGPVSMAVLGAMALGYVYRVATWRPRAD